MTTNLRNSWLLDKFWTVWRIWILILGCKGLREKVFININIAIWSKNQWVHWIILKYIRFVVVFKFLTGIKLYLIVYPYLEFTLSEGVSFKLGLSSSPIGILLHFLNIILRLLRTFKGHILWKKNYTHSPAETFTCSLLKKI